MTHFIQQFDQAIDSWVRHIPKSFDRLFRIASASGFPIAVYVIASGLFLAGVIYGDGPIRFAAYVIVVVHITSSVLKLTLRRRRPITYLPHRWTFKTHSFPSGHAAGSSIAYGTLVLVWLYLQLPASAVVAALALVWIVTIGVSRIYLGAHYASDVLGGWCLGVVGILVIYCI